MKKVVIIDNFDSFTYNLYHLVEMMEDTIAEVVRVDKVELDKLGCYNHLIFSPGPGLPKDYPTLFNILRKYEKSHKILGVCLGHQAIMEYYGAKISNLNKVVHGKSSILHMSGSANDLYKELELPVTVGRYHSWGVVNENVPDCLDVSAFTEDGIIMSVKHKKYDITGIQFHPESVLTPNGKQLIYNWMNA